MKRSLITLSVVLLTILALAGRAAPTLAHPGTDYCIGTEEAKFLVLINDHRAANNLPPLQVSKTIGAAAEHHAQDMADQNYSEHTGKDGSSPKDRLVAHGYDEDTFWGENIYYGSGDAQDAFDWWKGSPGHNANMLSTNFVAIGISVAESPNSPTPHWATVFGGVMDEEAKPCDDMGGGNGGGNGGGMGNGGGQGDDGADDGADDGNGNGDRPDKDNDGLYDDDEEDVYDTDPNKADTDGDGYDDGEEVFYNTDPTDEDDYPDANGGGNGGQMDSDNDGLYDDDEENVYGTDPDNADTDDDGYEDGEEVYYDTDPTDPNDNPGGGNNGGEREDSDNDGLYDDDEENVYGTDPNNPDSDDDGYEDGEEVFYNTDPNNADDYPDN